MSADAQRSLDVILAAIADALESVVGPQIPPQARADLYARARQIAGSSPTTATAQLAALRFASDLYLALAVELAARPDQQRDLIAEIERVSGIPAVILGREVLGAPRLALLPSSVACEVALAMLASFAGAEHAALFTRTPTRKLSLLSQAGRLDAAKREVRAFARQLLEDREESGGRRPGLAGTVLGCTHANSAALVVRGATAADEDTMSLVDATGALLSAVLDRDLMLPREPEVAADVSALERRLARLRFDLHDGPQQDVIMLADDLRLFATQLASVYRGSEHAEILLGRLDDLQARLVTIDGDLRRIAAFVQSPFLRPESLPQALGKLIDRFVERSPIEPTVELTGSFEQLTDSQQITLLGLIREALNNIREHSGATSVSIRLHADRTGVSGSVTDNGRGFDPETMLVKAARGGHLGLVGMYERVRMLGGVTDINSRPGGPTVISVTLPPQQ